MTGCNIHRLTLRQQRGCETQAQTAATRAKSCRRKKSPGSTKKFRGASRACDRPAQHRTRPHAPQPVQTRPHSRLLPL
jgi:hypothetical protein